MEERLLTWHDLNRCFFLGSLDPVWKIVELMEDTVLCNMLGTEDCVVLPHEMVAPLLSQYEEYWDEVARAF